MLSILSCTLHDDCTVTELSFMFLCGTGNCFNIII